MLDLRKTIQETPAPTPPIHCPDCHQLLLGSWDCPACGLELESPERVMKHRIASVDSISFLPPGYFFIPDPERNRLLLMNAHTFNYVSWQLDLQHLLCEEPWDVLWLANQAKADVLLRTGVALELEIEIVGSPSAA